MRLNEENRGERLYKIFIYLVLGVLAGLALQNHAAFAVTYIKPFGTIFVNLLKAVVVPVVLLSIICGMISMDDVKKVGSVGWKTLVYYMCTTAVAIVIGLVVANLFKGAFPLLETADAAYEAKSSNLMDTIVNIFPSNMWSAFFNANMLQVIVIALFFGGSILAAGEESEPVKKLVDSMYAVIEKLMTFIISLSPIGVFTYMAWVVATQGAAILGSLALVLLCAYLGYFIHAVIVYSISAKFGAGLNPLKFFKEAVTSSILGLYFIVQEPSG